MDRLSLQSLLEEKLGSRNVYYQPPASIVMKYPAIRYSLQDYYIVLADDAKYSKRKRYELIVIAKEPDNPVIEKLLSLDYCTYRRRYVVDNLYHDVLVLYY